MTRVEEIIAKVRRSLGDSKTPYRHTTEDLLLLLNDGLRDIAVRSLMFRGVAFIPIVRGQANYSLPSDLIKLNKAVFNDRPLPLKTSYYMEEKISLNWRTHTAEEDLECLVYDQADVQRIYTYPRLLGETIINTYTFSGGGGDGGGGDGGGGDGGGDNGEECCSLGFANITDFTADLFGITNYLSDEISATLTDAFGIPEGVADVKAIIIFYNRSTKKVLSVTDEPEVPEFYDKALQHYITGYIYRDDVEKQNRAMGAEELSLAESIVDEIVSRSSSHRVSNSVHSTVYRGIG